MKRSALLELVDPDSLEPLELRETRAAGDDVIEGSLERGGVRHPIQEGIPSFFSHPPGEPEDQTIRSFAQKWSRHRYYREHTRGFYTDWYLQRYGLRDLDGLRELLDGMEFVLDAGTGSGRDAVTFAENSNATVYGVDTAWDALVPARQDVAEPRVAFVHASVNHLPFPDDFFDLVSCDQVIHHTPDPRRTFEDLRRKLKPGGQICCYVYKKKAVLREFADDYVRDRIADLPIDEALAICEPITKLGKALADLDVQVEVEEDIPVLGIPKGRMDIQRFFHWHVMKCFWNEDFDFHTNNIVNFDWYHPRNCFRFEPDEFRSWFADGWEIQAWDVQEAGISCRATKV